MITDIDKTQLKLEIDHIFESGANEIRVYEMVVNFINKRYEQKLPIHSVMQAEGSACAKCGGTGIIKGGPTDSRKDSPCDCAVGATDASLCKLSHNVDAVYDGLRF